MFVPKIRLFPLFYWFVNFTLTDKHGTKNLSGLIRPWIPQEKFQVREESLSCAIIVWILWNLFFPQVVFY